MIEGIGGILIESYDFGRVVINGTEYTSDVIVMGEKIQASWWRREGHVLHSSDMKDALEEFQPEVVVIGTGYAGMMRVLGETKQYLQTKGIELLVERTEKACKLFNSLSGSKRVLAALHLTC
ncbi:Mth938-like domain-containing protein [[Eubacterium] cellulosolvens]